MGGVVGGPCDFSASPRSKSFFFLFWGTFIRLGGLLGQGLGLGLGPGLDNFCGFKQVGTMQGSLQIEQNKWQKAIFVFQYFVHKSRAIYQDKH